MRYQKPYDQSDPNAGYVNGNPSAGISGSIPPAEQMEYPQREIVNAIVSSGQTPSDGDLFQLWKSIQAGGASGSATYISSLSIVGGRLAFFSATSTWTCPANVTKVRVVGQAGGGGGGAGNGSSGAGGLGGDSFEGVFSVSEGNVYAVTVGLGGSPGTGSTPGGNGGISSFGPQGASSFASVVGGSGGNSGTNSTTPGITNDYASQAAIAFPNGGFILRGGPAGNGVILPSVATIGGVGGGARFSPTTPVPYGIGSFPAAGFGGGGSGGAGSTAGGAGAAGLVYLEY